jgi:hypothetical protein
MLKMRYTEQEAQKTIDTIAVAALLNDKEKFDPLGEITTPKSIEVSIAVNNSTLATLMGASSILNDPPTLRELLEELEYCVFDLSMNMEQVLYETHIDDAYTFEEYRAAIFILLYSKATRNYRAFNHLKTTHTMLTDRENKVLDMLVEQCFESYLNRKKIN